MNKEEATERCKQIIKDNNEIIKEARKNRDINSMQLTASLDNDSIAIETVLNLLEKKDKQIEQYQNMLATNDMLHVLECEKKDKIIDELEDIFYNYQLCEYELTDCTYRKCEYIADDEISPCKDCIKQYFEKKVEENKCL